MTPLVTRKNIIIAHCLTFKVAIVYPIIPIYVTECVELTQIEWHLSFSQVYSI